jgi:uncharacterized protein (DUF58 family)
VTSAGTVRTQAELSNARSRIVGTRDGFLADTIVALVRSIRLARQGVVTAWRWITSVVTRLGWSLAIIIVLSFVAGYGLGWIEAVVIAWTGLALVLLALLYLIGRSAYDVRLSLPTSRVVVGEKAPGEVIVGNQGRRRLASARIEVPVGLGLAEFAMPSLARGNSFQDVFLVPTTRRGVVPIGPVRTVRADPVGILRRELIWASALDLFVHPRTIAIPSMSTGFIRDLEGAPTRDLTSSDVAFHSLREYVPGDERRNIHWKSTAKTGSYMVRQYEETKRSHLMIALSLADADYADPAEFELAVSVVGSLGVRAIHDSRTLSVVASETTPEFAKRQVHAVRTLSTLNRGRLLDELSLVETATTALRLAELATVASEASAATSIAFLVCGSSVTPTQLRAASSQFPLGVSVVTVICDAGSVPAVRRVGELTVVTIGYLEDLQKSLARRSAVA